MKLYELTYLITPEISEEELKSLQEKLTSLIQKEEGFLNEVSYPVEKNLAYLIKKKQKAFLLSLSFQLKPEKLKNLEEKLKKEEKILRYLILTKKMPKKVSGITSIPKKKSTKEKPKVELKEIEKKLEEMLGQ